MNKEEILQFINENPCFHLATVEGDQPRVRGMLLFRADENGLIFHTATTKDVFKQALANSKAEMCFFSNGTQIRVSGVLKQIKDDKLREEIYNHPTRKFLQVWTEKELEAMLQIFVLKDCVAVEWTMDKNFEPKHPVKLS